MMVSWIAPWVVKYPVTGVSIQDSSEERIVRQEDDDPKPKVASPKPFSLD